MSTMRFSEVGAVVSNIAAQSSEHAARLDSFSKAVSPHMKVFAHSVFMCGLVRASGKYAYSFWLGLMMSFVMGFFGGFTSNLLMNELPNIFKLDWILVGHFVAHWLLSCVPHVGDAYARAWPVSSFCKMCSNVMRVHTIFDRLELARAHYPGACISPILLGFIGGSGGGITADTIDVFTGAKPVQQHELLNFGFTSRTGFLFAIVYYIAVHYFGLDANAVAGTVVAFVIAHGLAQDILGRTLDYTLKPASMLQWMLNIPNTTEPAKPKPKPRAPSTAKAPAKTPAKAPAKTPAKAPAKTPAKPKATPAPAPEPATRTSTRSRKKKD